jgi:hypothetical protein
VSFMGAIRESCEENSLRIFRKGEQSSEIGAKSESALLTLADLEKQFGKWADATTHRIQRGKRLRLVDPFSGAMLKADEPINVVATTINWA